MPCTSYIALTPREIDVLSLIAQGLHEAEAADTLGISPNTVHSYMRTIRIRLGAQNAAHAVYIAVVLSDSLPTS